MTRELVALLFFVPASLAAADCLPCHAAQTSLYKHSGMNRALARAGSVESLKSDDVWKLTAGSFRYEVRRSERSLMYSVKAADGSGLETPLAWAFGAGETGITWLYERAGKWHETRVSWYPALKGLALTVGAANDSPTSLADAAGRALTASDAAECFGCHSTGGVKGTEISFATMKEGITCALCHQPAGDHAKAGTKASVRNPGKGTTEEISEFCGACHRTWEQVQLLRIKGINTIRFQPYRLTNSKCYDAEDKRISCTACHDPHAVVERRSAAYDAKCMACHNDAKKCSVAQRDCTTCHMQKFELPGAHAKFTDHQIRIARPGEPFPN